ncbi:hypothetical protein DL89DRAFT_265538 [Linderina pennispora]|uniref:Uncharacterized protein n=1 Tax=Linderina pennispora TaxID=61395 RepID=A0A1Y1WE94_9FUNG|nr:uncharacterized protein DL89DRAFT_265538 [Linderina pennispora]ORX71827.1 hypothetical protein DL89DRAFT_265538 [Linderina pennispora]
MYSTAQTLPTLILEPIFLNLLGIDPEVDSFISSSEEEEEEEQLENGLTETGQSGKSLSVAAALSLTGCCQHWRDVALGAIFRYATVGRHHRGAEPGRWLNSVMVDHSLELATGLGIATSVRFVMLSFDLCDILDGTAIDELLQTPIRFYNAVDNIFPGAKRVIIQCANLVNWVDISGQFIDELFSGLMRGKTCIRIGGEHAKTYSVVPGNVLRHSTGPLRTLVAFGIGEGSVVGEIIRRNSGTLEVLHFGTMDPNVVRTILFNNDGTPVVYDRLTALNIVDRCEQITYANDFLMPSDGATFPMLESLVFSSRSLGLHEFLARGSGRLLTRVDWIPSHSTIERLIRYGFFNPERYPAIKSILLALRLCRNACNVLVMGDRITRLGDHLLDLDNLNPHVQILRMLFMVATIEEALGFIKTRPFLRRLGIACSEHAGCSATCVMIPLQMISSALSISHIALFCTDSKYVEELYKALDLYVQHVSLEGFVLAKFCMTLVYLFLLCPSLRTIDGGLIGSLHTIHRSQLQEYAEFKELEAKLLALVADM